MSKSIKVKGFLKDVSGINRIMAARHEVRENASATPDPKDFVADIAKSLHPDAMRVRVTEVRDSSPTSRTYRFVSENGHIPPFQSGQCVNFRLQIGKSTLTRPYSISSAPYEARPGKSISLNESSGFGSKTTASSVKTSASTVKTPASGNAASDSGRKSFDANGEPFFEITIRRTPNCFVPDWFFENVKVGDVLDANLPFGTFYWEPLRDTKNLVALAGGSGITPFVSMAKEIANGKMGDCTLTILYGSVRTDDIVLKDGLEAVAAKCDKIKIVHVISGDVTKAAGISADNSYEQGFVTRALIEKYMGENPTFYFCGPLPMYRAMKKALEEMGVPERRFRCDVLASPADPAVLPGYPAENRGKTYRITVVRGIEEDVVEAKGEWPVAVALERAGIPVDTHCRGGACGFCRSQLLSGDIFVSPLNDGRRMMDKELGWFHPCAAWPLSDLKIKIPIL
ncbi:MAG: flavin reductase family protein [Lachnospiraceae bacterium]|nr:flavin reductase family protein [Lachnospiraceae bacterium]